MGTEHSLLVHIKNSTHSLNLVMTDAADRTQKEKDYFKHHTHLSLARFACCNLQAKVDNCSSLQAFSKIKDQWLSCLWSPLFFSLLSRCSYLSPFRGRTTKLSPECNWSTLSVCVFFYVCVCVWERGEINSGYLNKLSELSLRGQAAVLNDLRKWQMINSVKSGPVGETDLVLFLRLCEVLKKNS